MVFIFDMNNLFLSLAFTMTLTFTHSTFAATEPVLSSGPISRGQYVTGGVLASTIGFGIGHAVQERYSTMGWIFTATEATGLLLLANAKCFRTRDSNSPDRAEREKSDCENPSQGIIGGGIMIGFHAWEIVDAWKNGNPRSQPESNVILLPSHDGGLISWSTRF
jgi:hypothetical protein